MSAVRMCDKCGTIFSENAEGWQTMSATNRRKNSEGQWINESVVLDSCPECSFQPATIPTVKAVLPMSKASSLVPE